MRRILWFRRDLRLEDNPLLALGGEVLPIFIFDTVILQKLKRDDRCAAFIFERVLALKKELQRKEKALAEAAALLVLQKKVQAIWGDPEDE